MCFCHLYVIRLIPDLAMQRPSAHHPNRRPHNWLIYDIQDRSLENARSVIRGTVYDLGCGESPYREWILQHARSYIGVDWSQSFHETTAEVLSNLNEPLPINDSVADTVLSLSVLEHLHQPSCMLQEAARLLKPGGHLLLQVPWQWHLHEIPHDYYRFTPYALRSLLNDAGLHKISITAQSGFFSSIALKVNYFTRRLSNGRGFSRRILRATLQPPWYLGQRVAPWLDKLDRDWSLETTGYFVTAEKASVQES